MANAIRLEVEVLNLRTRHPFIIARGGQSDYRTVWVRLVDSDGVEGWGEAAPARIYGEIDRDGARRSAELRERSFPQIRCSSRKPSAGGRSSCDSIPRRAARSPRRCTIWRARSWAMPVYRMWGLDPARAPRSTFTIGIDTADKIRQKVKEAEQYPILKIKLGSDRDLEILKTIREMHQQGNPGGRQHRLDREARDPRCCPCWRSSG